MYMNSETFDHIFESFVTKSIFLLNKMFPSHVEVKILHIVREWGVNPLG